MRWAYLSTFFLALGLVEVCTRDAGNLPSEGMGARFFDRLAAQPRGLVRSNQMHACTHMNRHMCAMAPSAAAPPPPNTPHASSLLSLPTPHHHHTPHHTTHNTIPQHHNTTTPQHHNTTQHNTTQQHNNTTTQQHTTHHTTHHTLHTTDLARLHMFPQPTTRLMPEETTLWFWTHPKRARGHLDPSLGHDSWTARHSKSTHAPRECDPHPGCPLEPSKRQDILLSGISTVRRLCGRVRQPHERPQPSPDTRYGRPAFPRSFIHSSAAGHPLNPDDPVSRSWSAQPTTTFLSAAASAAAADPPLHPSLPPEPVLDSQQCSQRQPRQFGSGNIIKTATCPSG